MEYIKKIYNDSKELTDKYIIVSIISLVLIMLRKSYFEDQIMNLLTIALPMAYFIYIKTNSGKRNFYTLNKIVSIILMILCVYKILNFVSVIVPSVLNGELVSLMPFLSIISFILSILFYLYWIAVFFLNTEQRKKILKDKFNNVKIGKALVIANVVVEILYLILYIAKYGSLLTNVVFVIIRNLLSLLLIIMQIRYVTLYQDFKEKKEKK